MSVLRLTGSFSEAEAHSWLATCLPDVPEKAPTEEHGQLCFSSTFLGTQLKCIYRLVIISINSFAPNSQFSAKEKLPFIQTIFQLSLS